MKSNEKPSTVEDLLGRFIAENALEPAKAKRFRSDFRIVVEAFAHPKEDQFPVEELPQDREAIRDRCRVEPPAPSISRYLRVVRWGIERGYLVPPEGISEDLGFPEFRRQEMTAEWRQARVVYETAIRFAGSRGTPFAEVDEEFWEAVFETHQKIRRSGRAEINAFKRVWRREAEAGRVPSIVFPDLPTKKPKAYRAKEAEIPEVYQPGLKAIRQWLEDSIVKGRGKKRKKRAISIQQQLSNLYRYFGYFINIKKEDLTGIGGWEHLCTRDRVLEFIFFTDPQASVRTNGHRYTSGVHQESHITTLIDFLSGPLNLPEAGQQLVHLRRQFLFEKKHQLIPEDLCPNDIYRVANQLLDLAEQEEGLGHLVKAGILRRDALLITLTMLWPRRVDLWHRLRLDKHVLLKDGKQIRICLFKEESKPDLRDQVFEVPVEVEGLFYQYLNVDRLRIIGDAADGGHLFVAEGGQSVKRDTPRIIFRNRMRDFLKTEFGTHALRKLWTPRYLDYSHGDYLTAMMVLDTSMINIITAYRDGQSRTVATSFVNFADELSKEILNGD